MTTKATRDVLDLATRPVLNVDINGGTIDGTPIGATTPDVGYFTNLTASNLTVTTSANFTGASTTGLTAFYADVAENYLSDVPYKPGTVVRIGGSNEITQTREEMDIEVFGVVSTRPGFVLNQKFDLDPRVLPVALIGRVPCRIVGPVKRGDRLVSSSIPGVARAMQKGDSHFAIIGRALVANQNEEEKLVEIVVTVTR